MADIKNIKQMIAVVRKVRGANNISLSFDEVFQYLPQKIPNITRKIVFSGHTSNVISNNPCKNKNRPLKKYNFIRSEPVRGERKTQLHKGRIRRISHAINEKIPFEARKSSKWLCG